MVEVKKIFKLINLLFLLINFVLLVITCVLYISTSKGVLNTFQKQRSLVAIMNRNTNMELLNQKMRLIIEDMIVIMKAYDMLVEWEKDSYNEVSASIGNYLYSASKVTQSQSEDYATFTQPWFINTDKDILLRRFKGIWFTYKESQHITAVETSEQLKLGHLCLITELMTSIFNKQLDWKNKMYITLDSIYFTFQSGTYYEFPATKLNIPSITKCEFTTTTASLSDPSYYDPRCRPYYKQALDSISKVTISQPYKFTSHNYGNDICIKSKNFTSDHSDVTYADKYLLCYAFTFFDFHLIQNQVEEILKKTDKVIYLIYFNPEDNAAKVLFNSLYYTNEVSCRAMTSPQPNYDCESIDLFVVYAKKLLDSINEIGVSDEEYVGLYNKAKKAFNTNVILPLNGIATSNSNLYDITLNNFKEEDRVKFAFTSNKEYVVSYEDKELIKMNSEIQSTFYLFPLLGGYTYEDDYSIKSTKEHSYYLLIQEKDTSIKKTEYDFIIIFWIEILLYLVYLIICNGLIWAVFTFMSHYIIKGFLYPLDLITALYISVGKKILKAHHSSNSLRRTLSIKLKKTNKTELKQSIIEKGKYFNETITNYVMTLFKSNQYTEVKESLTTLQCFNILVNSKHKQQQTIINSIDFLMKNSNYLEMNTFFEALFFLFDCFYSNLLGKQSDSKILKLLIENLMSLLLKDFDSLNEDKKKDKVKYIKDFYNEKILKVIHGTKQLLKNEKHQALYGLEYAYHCLDNLSKLEENIMYNYSIHNTLLVDELILKDYDSKPFNAFDSDKEEQIKMNRLNNEDKKKKRKNNTVAIGFNEGGGGGGSEAHNKNEDFRIGNDVNKKIDYDDDTGYNSYSNDIQSEIDFIINNLTAYLEIYKINRKGSNANRNYKKTITLHDLTDNGNDNNDNETEHILQLNNANDLNYHYSYTKSSINPWILECANKLKELSALVILSNYHMIKRNKSKGLLNAKEAFNKLFELEKYINDRKSTNTQLAEVNWKKTNFILTTIYIFFIEKVFFSIGLFYELYHQTHNALFVYINILDLGPMYSLPIRRMILIKLLTLVKRFQTGIISQSDSVESLHKQISLPHYINHNLIRIKLSTILNITSDKVNKQITFLFDLSNQFMKSKLIKSIIQLYSNKNMNPNKDIVFHFGGFDSILHIVNDYYPEEESPKVALISKEAMNKRDLTTKSNNETEEDEMKIFFSFIERYNSDKDDEEVIGNKAMECNANENDEKAIRADNALYNNIKHCFQDWKDIEDKKRSLKEKRSNDKQLITLNNYLIMMVDLKSYFHDKKKNWKEISKLLFEKKISLVIILVYDEKISNEVLKEKIKVYKAFLQRFVINGHLFVMRSLSMLKLIFNSVFPIRFSEFNTELINHFLKNIEQIDGR